MAAVMIMNTQGALRRTLDALVSSWMQRIARPHLETVDSTMIAMSLTHQDFPKQPPPQPATAGMPNSRCVAFGQPAAVSTPFRPLDPGVLNASIPAFFIGRNGDGFWLARDVKGKTGGIFLLRSSALAFARRHSWPSGCATIFPSERFELDLENQGNPLIAYLGPLMRLAMRG